MKLVSRNENDDGGCVLACIDLTPRLLELALRRIESLSELQAQDQDADEIYYWNYDAVFFDPFFGPGHDGEPEDPRAAIECGQMIVPKEGVAFIAVPKHASFYVETAQVPGETLRRAARLA